VLREYEMRCDRIAKELATLLLVEYFVAHQRLAKVLWRVMSGLKSQSR